MRRCGLCGQRDDFVLGSEKCSYDGPWHQWGEPESTDPQAKIAALRMVLKDTSARPWHLRLKDRNSSAVAVIWEPGEGVDALTLMCSQPARYRKHGDGHAVIMAVNHLEALVAIAEAALSECSKFRFPEEDRPGLWDALQRLGEV